MNRPKDALLVWLEYQKLIGEFIGNHPAYMVPIVTQTGFEFPAYLSVLKIIIRDQEAGNEIADAFLKEAVARKLFDPFGTHTIVEIDEMDRLEDEGRA